MASSLTEEQVTKFLISWLELHGWEIICFDFPQSGTGVYLHPDNTRSKNLRSIIPDIIAYRQGIVVYFENKDHFYLKDFEKVEELRKTNAYEAAFARLLGQRKVEKIYYGIGVPLTERIKKRAIQEVERCDFIVFVSPDTVEVVGLSELF